MYSFLLNCYWLYQEISAKACGNPQTISIGLIPGPPQHQQGRLATTEIDII